MHYKKLTLLEFRSSIFSGKAKTTLETAVSDLTANAQDINSAAIAANYSRSRGRSITDG